MQALRISHGNYQDLLNWVCRSVEMQIIASLLKPLLSDEFSGAELSII